MLDDIWSPLFGILGKWYCILVALWPGSN